MEESEKERERNRMVVGVNEEHDPVLVHHAAKRSMHLRLCAGTIHVPLPAALAPAAAHELWQAQDRQQRRQHFPQASGRSHVLLAAPAVHGAAVYHCELLVVFFTPPCRVHVVGKHLSPSGWRQPGVSLRLLQFDRGDARVERRLRDGQRIEHHLPHGSEQSVVLRPHERPHLSQLRHKCITPRCVAAQRFRSLRNPATAHTWLSIATMSSLVKRDIVRIGVDVEYYTYE